LLPALKNNPQICKFQQKSHPALVLYSTTQKVIWDVKTVYNQANVHSSHHTCAFSLQEGLLTPTDLVQAAQADGMKALGLTDHNLLTVIEFANACREASIQHRRLVQPVPTQQRHRNPR